MSTRHYGPNLVVDGGAGLRAARYDAEVLEQLRQIAIFDTGRIVLRAIMRGARQVRVVPWTSTVHNADVTPTHWIAAEPAGVPVLDGNGVAMARFRGRVGTGAGSDAVVRYSPATFQADAGGWNRQARLAWATVTGHAPPAPGDDRGEMLLHELVHAYRMTLGLLHPRPAGMGYDTREELIAVTVANLYSAERDRPLRADHTFTTPALADYAGRLMTPEFRHTLLAAMVEMPALANALAGVRARPNPFAQYALPTLSEIVSG